MDVYDKLRAPLGNIFFGGEAMSLDNQGSVHGAYSAGVMAAENCQRYLWEKQGNLESLSQVSARHETLGTNFPLQISRIWLVFICFWKWKLLFAYHNGKGKMLAVWI